MCACAAVSMLVVVLSGEEEMESESSWRALVAEASRRASSPETRDWMWSSRSLARVLSVWLGVSVRCASERGGKGKRIPPGWLGGHLRGLGRSGRVFRCRLLVFGGLVEWVGWDLVKTCSVLEGAGFEGPEPMVVGIGGEMAGFGAEGWPREGGEFGLKQLSR